MSLTFAPTSSSVLPLYLVKDEELQATLDALPQAQREWAKANGFKAGFGRVCVLPSESGVTGALAGLGSAKERKRERFALAAIRAAIPAGTYRLETGLSGSELDEQLLGWLLAGYRFGAYKEAKPPAAQLVAPQGADVARLEAIAAGEALSRDLINTPASDMGPAELEAAARDLAMQFDASLTVIDDQKALEDGYPMIHAVGRASTRPPRLIDMKWGRSGPKLTLVGKGVCFDTGGLNIKPGASMGLMKKDMGGAATVLGLAQMIMALNLDLQLRVLIPAVENSISGDSFRPQDVLRSRKGLTVEINNTDAEGRLVLADALALADEEKPDLIVSMATLTGAARVAVGPDLAPFFATDSGDAATLIAGAERAADPVWPLPFWDGYESMIEPAVADLDNAPKGGMAGAITAALFLRRFVTETPRYMHFDIYGWCPASKPGRPKGGVAQGARALLESLPELLSR